MGAAAAIAAVKRMQGALRALSKVPSQAAGDASEEIARLIEQQFDAGVDPYGNAWEPLMQGTIDKGRSPPPLTDTHAMRDSVEVRPMPRAGISVTIGGPAAFHQVGTKNMAARPILPERALPDTWQRAIADAVDNAGERALAGAV